MIREDDRVVITSKNNIKATVIGFYKHSNGIVVKTDAGNEWIITEENLKKVENEKERREVD